MRSGLSLRSSAASFAAKAMLTLAITSAVIATTAHAEPVAIEAGAAHLTLATPTRESGGAATVSAGVGVGLRPTVDVMLRGHVTFGDSFVTALGPYLQHRLRAPLIVGYGLSIARVVGPSVDEPADRARGLGVGAELRVGVRFGSIAVNAHALPIWVFANDSIQAESRLTGALELGITLGYQR